MKAFHLFLTSFMFLSICAISHAQNTSTLILGKWILESEDIYNTIYFANDWNSEEITFNPDYSFFYTQNEFENNQIITHEIKGNWLISKDSSSIILFNGLDRYQKDIQLKTVFKELPIYFINKNYFAWREASHKSPSIKRFMRESVTSSFENDFASYQHEQLLKSKIIDSKSYFAISNSDTTLKQYKSAHYSFVSKFTDYSDNFFRKTITSNGRILRITDTSVIYKPNFIFNRTITKSNSKIRSLEIYKDGTQKEIALKNIQAIYNPVSTIGMEASFWLTAASAVSAVIVAPIVGFLSESNLAKKHYVNTVGVSLIGVGIGTGSFFIFRSLKKTFHQKAKNSLYLAPRYLSKK